jgi:ketosteroid isomerase-like protein
MDDDRVTDADLAKLIELVSDATSAFIRGDMRRYLALITHTDDYTLIAPTGGETIQGFEISEERLTQMERFFKTGDATLEVVQTYASGNLAVLVVVERQHGEVSAYPAQDWSLRATLVFRREGSEWRLAHRHADALVHPITFDQTGRAGPGLRGSPAKTGQSDGDAHSVVVLWKTFEHRAASDMYAAATRFREAAGSEP